MSGGLLSGAEDGDRGIEVMVMLYRILIDAQVVLKELLSNSFTSQHAIF